MTRLLLLLSLSALLITTPSKEQTNSEISTLKQLIVKNAAALNFSKTDLENYRIANSFYDESINATLAYVQQTWQGIDIYNAITVIAFRNDKLVSVQSSKIDEPEIKAKGIPAKPFINAAAALSGALGYLNLNSVHPSVMLSHSANNQAYEYDKAEIALNNISVRLMWTPVEEDKKLILTWQVALVTLKENDHWLVKVNALNGNILRKDNLTSNCRGNEVAYEHSIYCYEVESFDEETKNISGITNSNESFKDVEKVDSAKFNVIPYPYQDPNYASPAIVVNPWTINGWKKAYPKKWNSDRLHDYTDKLKGNNVYAYADTTGTNFPSYSPPSQTALPNLTWNYAADFDNEPVVHPAFGVVNLFYWVNLMHDISYNYGFTEAEGNMQTNNFSRGGEGNDLVLAEAMDKSTANNANFATPSDGQQSRMQIGLFDPSRFAVLDFKSPPQFKGHKPSLEGAVSDNNLLIKTGSITSLVVIYKDSLDADSSEACSIAANANELKGKIAYIDRGDCPFVNKYQNAQAAGAIAIIVGNVAPDDPRYDGTNTGNFLIRMVANPLDNTITIPGTFIPYDTVIKLKNYLQNGIHSKATLSPAPHIDGDLDNSLITHEYTHGISNRLTGQNVNCLNNAEQPGEGWSDYFALMMLTNWQTANLSDSSKPRTIGNYASGLDEGVSMRRHPYSKDFSIDPWTYDTLRTDATIIQGNFFPVGEIWCSALWDMTWNLIKTEGFNRTFFDSKAEGGNTTAMKLVMQGMALQKCSPGCVDARNAILSADTLLFGGGHAREIWTAFARRGMGYSANQGSSLFIKDGTGAYDLPPNLNAEKSYASSNIQTTNTKTVVRISPNPATDQLTITIPANTAKLNIQLLNNNGAVLGNYTLNSESININVSQLSAGIYNLVITGEKFISRYRVVIN